MDDNFHSWKIIPSKIFSVFGGTNIIFHTNTLLSLRCRKNVDKIPSFYRDLVYLWQNVISLKSSETTEICDESCGIINIQLVMETVYMTRILSIKELSKLEILSMRQEDHSTGLKQRKILAT